MALLAVGATWVCWAKLSRSVQPVSNNLPSLSPSRSKSKFPKTQVSKLVGYFRRQNTQFSLALVRIQDSLLPLQ